MALFTDGSPAGIDYLRSYESNILEVARTESIDLDVKLALASEEIGAEIVSFIAQHSASRLVPNFDWLATVAVTPPLRRWHALRTLELVFGDAYGSQLNDRYRHKKREYASAARRAGDDYFQRGVGIVQRPVRQAGLPVASAASAAAAAYYARIAWTGADGAEGAPGDIAVIALEPGSTVMPPFDDYPAWNLYVGPTRESLRLQNAAPMPAAASWTFDGSLVADSREAGSGQPPDYFIVDYRRLPRG